MGFQSLHQEGSPEADCLWKPLSQCSGSHVTTARGRHWSRAHTAPACAAPGLDLIFKACSLKADNKITLEFGGSR